MNIEDLANHGRNSADEAKAAGDALIAQLHHLEDKEKEAARHYSDYLRGFVSCEVARVTLELGVGRGASAVKALEAAFAATLKVFEVIRVQAEAEVKKRKRL